MNLALFDFDGTITDRDSFLDFLLFSQNKTRLLLGATLLAPVLFLYKTGLLDNGKAKEIVLCFFFKGMNQNDFQLLCENYSKEKLLKLFRKNALRKIQWHLQNRDRVVIISASIENYLAPLAKELGVEVLATKLEFSEKNVFTGKYSGKNCYGSEKVARLRSLLRPEEFKEIHAYGDSKGDKEMLKLAHKAYYKPFR